MRLDFVKIYLDSITDMLRQVIDPEAEVSGMRIEPDPVTGGEVMAIIGLMGEAEGKVIFDLERQTAIRVAGHMMEEPLTELNAVARSALAELASMATGKALSDINDSGTRLHMSPPLVISGSSLESYDQSLETLVVPVDTACGEIRINITVRDLK
ncbi:MAG TPA: chemotaxis protein CheX [Blastocatellia bacterium]|nr:chemotaxis protein CheX [Blastocatellia bacterium]